MTRLLARLTRAATPAPHSDGHLLAAFLADRSERAFAALVERHAPMVYGVCVRVLRHRQDAEDAFQAAFLVLARRAADVWPRDAVGSWLYGVAYRVAMKARSLRAKRFTREQPLGDVPPEARPAGAEPELAEVVDRAVRSLPDVYRAAVLACDVEGRSRREAAEHLGWSEGTLSGRLARARRLLADRLRRAGVTPPAAGLSVVLGTAEAVACGLVAETVRAAVAASGGTPGPGASASVLALSEGVVQGMFLAKLKAAMVVVLATATLGLGVWSASGAGDGPGDGVGEGEQPKPSAKSGGKKGVFDTPRRAEPTEKQPEKSTEKMSDDLRRMQGRWRVVSVGDGKTLNTMPEGQPAPEFEIVGNRMYGPLRGTEKRGDRERCILTVRPGKPGEIDLAEKTGEPFRGIYRFAGDNEPRPGNLWIAVVKEGLRPTKFEVDFPKQGEVTEVARVPGGPGAGNPNATEKRGDLALLDLHLWLVEEQTAPPPASPEEAAERLRRQKARLAAALKALDDAQREPDKAKERPKPPAGGANDLIKEAQARREIERQRAQVVLDDLRRQAAAAQANRLAAVADARKAEVALRVAEAKVAELLDNLAAAQKTFDELNGGPEPAAPLELRDDAGNRVPVSEEAAAALTELAHQLLRGSRGELTGGKGDAPFATAERWAKLRKSGYLLVRLPKNAPNRSQSTGPAEILVPVSATRAPEYLLVRNGDTYRALFDFPEEQAKALQMAVAALGAVPGK